MQFVTNVLHERDFKRRKRNMSAAETRFNNVAVSIAANGVVRASEKEDQRAQGWTSLTNRPREEAIFNMNGEH